MSTASEGMLGKIRGLLARAEHPETPKPEAEACMAKAVELMTKYGVEQAMLSVGDPTLDRVGDRIIVIPAPYSYAKLCLLNSITLALGARAVMLRSKRPGVSELHIFGMQSDLERIDLLFTSLLIQCLRFMSEDAHDNNLARNQPRKWKRDFLDGFTAQVYARIKAAQERAEYAAEREHTSGPSVALVLVSRAEKVERAMRDRYTRINNKKSYRTVGEGYFSGQYAGNRADLGGSGVDSRRHERIGS